MQIFQGINKIHKKNNVYFFKDAEGLTNSEKRVRKQEHNMIKRE